MGDCPHLPCDAKQLCAADAAIAPPRFPVSQARHHLTRTLALSRWMKNLAPKEYRPLLWMLPGFALTFFAYWYPTWVDRRIPEKYDSRIWMLVAFDMHYSWWASLTVLIAYAFLLFAACKERNVRILPPIALGLLMFAPSAWLIWRIGSVWFRE